jgi:hypothetical protein
MGNEAPEAILTMEPAMKAIAFGYMLGLLEHFIELQYQPLTWQWAASLASFG